MNIDYSRIAAEIREQEDRLAQMHAFVAERAAKLTAATSDIESLLAKHKCTSPKMENAYSGGHGPQEYSNLVAMHITCKATRTEGIKNTILFENRLTDAWQDIGQKYGIRISRVYVNGNTVEIHLFVR